MATPKYHINVFFIADVLELKHCSAFGETPEKAMREIMIAMRLWLESAKAAGKRVPKPRYRPAIYQGAS